MQSGIAISWRGRFTPGLKDLNKRIIIEGIVAALTRELEGYMRSAKAAHAEATDEQSKAENKYDTRGLEASYLARGQSRQALEVLQAIQAYQTLPLRAFSSHEPIDVGAVVELEHSSERACYFIGPRAGGTEVECEGAEVLVITPQSPMGQQLVGRKQGEHVEIQIGRDKNVCQIAKVH